MVMNKTLNFPDFFFAKFKKNRKSSAIMAVYYAQSRNPLTETVTFDIILDKLSGKGDGHRNYGRR
ncbi:MAG: hypothetical protein RSA52_10175 [Acetivibrio sp.]